MNTRRDFLKISAAGMLAGFTSYNTPSQGGDTDETTTLKLLPHWDWVNPCFLHHLKTQHQYDTSKWTPFDWQLFKNNDEFLFSYDDAFNFILNKIESHDTKNISFVNFTLEPFRTNDKKSTDLFNEMCCKMNLNPYWFKQISIRIFPNFADEENECKSYILRKCIDFLKQNDTNNLITKRALIWSKINIKTGESTWFSPLHTPSYPAISKNTFDCFKEYRKITNNIYNKNSHKFFDCNSNTAANATLQ